MMVELVWPILVYAAAGGVFAASALLLITQGTKPQIPARWTAALLMFGACTHAVDNVAGILLANAHRDLTRMGPALIAVWLLSAATAGFFWAFVQASFEDRHAPLWRRLWPAAMLIALALVGAVFGPILSPSPWLLYNLAVAALMGHALWVLAQGWRGDLVERRRRLRGPIILATIIYILLVQAGDILTLVGVERDQPSWRLSAFLLLGLAFGALAILFRVDDMILAPPPTLPDAAAEGRGPGSAEPGNPAVDNPPAPLPGVDPQDRALAARLEKAMAEEAIWRREDLSIGVLAQELKTPEHRLRHLINAQLGHRNFAAFVNARRIEAAKAALADPENGRRPVSAIAFDLGFGSLGPFNRAFKDATGVTPTQWRLQALSASPKTESSDRN